MAERFACYLALGDSMSIDFYPSQDARLGSIDNDNLGAASLFFKNENKFWPEFSGKDLDSIYPRIYFSNHTADGATTEDLLAPDRLAELESFKNARVLVTLTIGGNDLLQALRESGGQQSRLEKTFQHVLENYRSVITALNDHLRNALFLLNTVYDPTDGSGIIPGDSIHPPLPLQYLDRFNTFVRDAARSTSNAILCDVHAHFLGHGANAGADMWYWVPSPIEPGARGASEIRRVWITALEKWIETE